MNACREVGMWITENVRVPVERFFEEAEEACHEARRWVEREVRRPIERQRARAERRCRERSCNWWCLCCNKWFCWLEIVFYTVIEFIVEVVGEWLVETICEIVIKIIKIIVEIVIAVLRFVVVALVCLFTEPLGALEALGDLWFDVVDIVDEVGDLAKDILDDVSDLLTIVKEFLLKLGDSLGPVGRFFFGILAGLVDIVRRVVDGIAGIVEGVFDIVTGVLRLDFCAALEGLTKGVGFGLGQTLLAVLNVLSLGGAGSRSSFDRESLRQWLHSQLTERFSDDELSDMEERLNIHSSSFGTVWQVIPLISSISSRSDNFDLRQMHNDGVINLHEAAGYAPIGCKDAPVTRSIIHLVYKDTFLRVSLGDLRAYLNGTDSDAPEFQLVAGDKDILKDMLLVAKREFRELAIYLDWGPVRTFELTQENERMITAASVETMATRITADLTLSDICDLPAVLVFGYNPTRFGLASVFWRGGERKATAASVRGSFMTHLFGTILAHEMGHCFSLCHAGHDGMEHIMYTGATGGRNCGVDDPVDAVGGDLDRFTGGTFVEYILMGGEPRYTLDDGENAWLWILQEASECIND